MSVACLPVSHVYMHITSVCLFACSSQEPHVQTSPNFICMLPTTITQSFFLWRRCDMLWMTRVVYARPGIGLGDAKSAPCRPVFRLHTDLTLWCCVYTKPDSTGDSTRPRGRWRRRSPPPPRPGNARPIKSRFYHP